MLDNIPSGDEDDQEEELGTTEDSDDGDSVDSDSEESEDVESEDPYYDPFGNVRRCIRCSWEVVNNHCQSIECQVRYKRGSDGTSDTESMVGCSQL